jgi:hypothetical protein
MQAQKFLPILYDLVMQGDYFIQLDLEIIPQ